MSDLENSPGSHNPAATPSGAGRFAPSPTGELHLGNLRTALLAWLYARKRGAKFLIRVEDLDVGRVREPYVGQQLEDLAAFGIDWDAPPERQSERTELYSAALEQLEGAGRTYRCFCSRREIREAASALHGDPIGRYPGTCAELSAAESRTRADAGEPFAIRLRAGGASVAIEDRRHGEVAEEVDDLVLVRRDGVFAYNLAVVVDDHDEGITEVVRGDDLLGSTPGQALLCDLLGAPRPAWVHVPLILGADGQRLAKRHGSVTLAALRELGIETPSVCAFVARSLGIAHTGENPSPNELLERFNPDSIPSESLVLQEDWPTAGQGLETQSIPARNL